MIVLEAFQVHPGIFDPGAVYFVNNFLLERTEIVMDRIRIPKSKGGSSSLLPIFRLIPGIPENLI